MHHARLFVLLLAVPVLMTSCAAGTQSAGERPRSSQYVLTSEDLASTNELTAYDAIQRLRPLWLRPRAPSARGPAPIVVFVDNVRIGGVDYLSNLSLNDVEEIRFINPSDATTRWGTGVAGGVIEVTTKR